MSIVCARSLRRLAAWLLIVEQLLVGAGVALPCPAAAAGSAERFPCEHCGCGCRSAEQCWAHCCCFTAQEKVAWAKRNGVAVPEYAVAAARAETAAAEKPKCRHCVRRADSQAKSSSAGPCSRARHDQARTEKRHPTGLSLLNALRCHGSTEFWQAAGASWPGDWPAGPGLVFPELGRILPRPFLKELFLGAAPPTPPPKQG